jgi:two-component system response regulator AtoC
LQVLQDGEFSRLGGRENMHVDVRVIAATNKNLESMVERQQFREDLYYRLNVINIFVPPLRERDEEIPVFCEYFLKKFSKHFNKKVTRIPDRLMEVFLRHDWPGNVRELENMIKRYVVLRDEKTIYNELIARAQPPIQEDIQVDFSPMFVENGIISLKEVGKKAAIKAERILISKVLQQTRGNRRKAAEILQISYKSLLYKIKECGVA